MLKTKKTQKIAILWLLTLLITNCNEVNNLGQKNNNQQKKSKQEPQKEDELNELISQEKALEKEAKNILKRLAKKHAPTQTFFKNMSDELDHDVEKSKQSLEEAKKLVTTNQAIQAELKGIEATLKGEGGVIKSNSIIIQNMFREFLEIPEIKGARKKRRPINPQKLSPDQKKWYKHVVKHFQGNPASDVVVFVSCVSFEETKKLLQVINVQVALFENIQKQHELRKEAA
jgi:hypothetical protein